MSIVSEEEQNYVDVKMKNGVMSFFLPTAPLLITVITIAHVSFNTQFQHIKLRTMCRTDLE